MNSSIFHILNNKITVSANRIRRHTQHYIIMQLVYGLGRIAVIESERLRENRKMD